MLKKILLIGFLLFRVDFVCAKEVLIFPFTADYQNAFIRLVEFNHSRNILKEIGQQGVSIQDYVDGYHCQKGKMVFSDQGNIFLIDFEKQDEITKIVEYDGSEYGYCRRPCFSPDGSKVAYIKSIQTYEYTYGGDIYCCEINSKKEYLLTNSLQHDCFNYADPVWIDTDRLLVKYGINSRMDGENRPRIVNINNGISKFVNEGTIDGEGDLYFYSKNPASGNRVVLMKSGDDPYSRLMLIYDLKSMKLLRVLGRKQKKEECYIFNYFWDKDRLLVLAKITVVVAPGGIPRYYLLEFNKDGKEIKRHLLDIGVIDSSDWWWFGGIVGQRVFFYHCHDWSDIYSFDLKNNKIHKYN